jgi:endonuclease YncB( thermonuclease family)
MSRRRINTDGFWGMSIFPMGKCSNEEIVRAGYASLLTDPPKVKYEQRFLKAYREARESKKGLWDRTTALPR